MIVIKDKATLNKNIKKGYPMINNLFIRFLACSSVGKRHQNTGNAATRRKEKLTTMYNVA